ncbi:MAG TPA: Zn-ribbon domain-containing OB-fold protein [Chloroflexota bacterium]|nr:Zn-ribbon domain-containing OB-fold protein [Chloroflexota bacterium]
MLETVEYRLPLPQPGPDDQAFWEGCKAHELRIQRCTGCGTLRYWGQPMCSRCNSLDSEAVKASGRGKIWSYTTTYHGFSRAWKEAVPYTVVVVELDEGPRMTSNLVDADPAAIKVGLPVEVVWDDVTNEVTLPKFRLAATA